MITPTVKQQEIRDHVGLDLRVVAPAGCGKTEALALRIQGILDRGMVAAPRRILVTTFSNRARDNIKERLSSYLTNPTLRDRVAVSNFHGLSARIFRAHAAVIGLDPEMTLPESDWVDEQTKARNLNYNDAAREKAILQKIKQQALNDADVERQLVAIGNNDAIDIERLRVDDNRLTYDDLPRLAELILQCDKVAELYQQHFGAVIVDEFQDLTPQQLRIVNRIGYQRTTYAGDLAQGIYGFAGARPVEVDQSISRECSAEITFNESHRSSPAVLAAVNALTPLTGGQVLTAAAPNSWPSGGLAALVRFVDVADEASRAVSFARSVLKRAPKQRIGVIARTANRRRFVDAAFETSGLSIFRWDDGVMDTDTAKLMKSLLSRLDIKTVERASNQLEYLREAVGLASVQDPSTREALASATSWCLDLITQGEPVAAIRKRIKIGDETTLLTAPGVHLLTGHVGKGQQFDWVCIVGAEQGTMPFFKAESKEDKAEEARVMSVMMSRARHGVVVTYTGNVPTLGGYVRRVEPSEFLTKFNSLEMLDMEGVKDWFRVADWSTIARR